MHDSYHEHSAIKRTNRATPSGGASGIGLMISSVLLANHATVYIVDLDEKQTKAIADRYSKLAQDSGSRGKMVGIQGDCSSRVSSDSPFEEPQGKVDVVPMQDAAEGIAKTIAQHESYVTVLFNNAGIMGDSAEPPKEPSGDAFKASTRP